MASKSKIEWTDSTWNSIYGCSKVSEGCRNCYAIREAHMHAGHPIAKLSDRFKGLTKLIGGKPEWTNQVNLWPGGLLAPLRWKDPRKIFVNSQSDTFHPDVPFEYIDKIFAVMALCPQHTFQVLTKRPERAAQYLSERVQINYSDPNTGASTRPSTMTRGEWIGMHLRGTDADPYWGTKAERERIVSIGCSMQFGGQNWPLPNVWLGTSCENQATANERIPHLLRCPAAVRFLSCEPLLGPIDLDKYLVCSTCEGTGKVGLYSAAGHLLETVECETCLGGDASIHWVIAGGESGPKARPMHPDWVRSLRDQCGRAGVPFLFKQWGEWAPDSALPDDFDSNYFRTKLPREYVTPKGEFDGQGIEPGIVVMNRVGKKTAGRLLDGRTWDEFPEVSA